jgi:hypothetical protein
MKAEKWENCYDDGWQGLIVPDAFAHPAKMARGLLMRIIRHIGAKGWLRLGGDVVVTEEILAEIQKDIDSGQYRRLE